MREKENKTNKVSLSEVARAAGVSKMTASRVLRQEGGYSEKTRAKVMEKVAEFTGWKSSILGYMSSGERV